MLFSGNCLYPLKLEVCFHQDPEYGEAGQARIENSLLLLGIVLLERLLAGIELVN